MIDHLRRSLCLFGLILTYSFCVAKSPPNVWDVLRTQFSLNHEVTQTEVQHQLRWLISHPSYLHKLAQSEPYIYHIVTEIKKRHLPGELALIPMIESAYDPFAYSGVGAAGLWQLMPGTGTDLGLKQDWWSDARRSIGPSTDAALNYLLYLNRFFNGDWTLAIAAYDSGEGTMARIIKNSQPHRKKVHFWSLNVPRETKAYVPRLLALAEIIQNPQRYHIQLPNIPHTPYFEEVNIGSQIDLNHAAKLAGISYHDLLKLNPGFNHWATAPYRPYKLLIPTEHVQDFRSNLAHLPENQRINWTRHLVSAGDNLNLIAHRYHTTINLIKELNQLKSNHVRKGQYVLIPSTKSPVTPTTPASLATKTTSPHFTPTQKAYKRIHIVQKNDSIPLLERKYGVSAQHIRQWNHLKINTALKQGQTLVIWRMPPAVTPPVHIVQQPPSKQPGFKHFYIVQKGDNLSKIARKNHMTLTALLSKNPTLKKQLLHRGQSIALGP